MAKTVKTVTSLSSIVQNLPDLRRIKDGLIQGFEEALKIRLISSQLTPFEWEMVQNLARNKYGMDVWNLHRHQAS